MSESSKIYGQKLMIGCTRCGRWHLDAEKHAGKNLSCTDVKQYWGKIREEHLKSEGHLPRIIVDDEGDWICMRCRKKLFKQLPNDTIREADK